MEHGCILVSAEATANMGPMSSLGKWSHRAKAARHSTQHNSLLPTLSPGPLECRLALPTPAYSRWSPGMVLGRGSSQGLPGVDSGFSGYSPAEAWWNGSLGSPWTLYPTLSTLGNLSTHPEVTWGGRGCDEGQTPGACPACPGVWHTHDSTKGSYLMCPQRSS